MITAGSDRISVLSTVERTVTSESGLMGQENRYHPFCMHALHHTYAARAIENGMQPKVLQKLLGHASIKTTMDRYVHVTDDSFSKAVLLFELNRKNQNGTVSTVKVPGNLENKGDI
jgi:integrase